MSFATQPAAVEPAAPAAPVCVLSVPVLSGRRVGTKARIGPTPPAVEVFATLREVPAKRDLDGHAADARTVLALAEASLGSALSGAYQATRAAAHAARMAERGLMLAGQARAATFHAEAARAEVAELAIAAAHAEGEIVEAQIATLALRLARAEMRASVASLLMTQGARVGITEDPSPPPMLTLIAHGAGAMRVDVFEADLLRLLAGNQVTLVATSGASAIDLRARLGCGRTDGRDPSRVVHGMFLTAECLPVGGKVRAVPKPSVGRERQRHA